jgi:transitional endoplasmic reticulum ATPase
MSTHLDSLRQAVSFSPDNVPLLLLLGDGCLDHFLFGEAKQHFQKALVHDAKNLGALLGVARTAYLEGNISEAVVRAEALATSHPECGAVWRLLSRLAFIESHLDQAREYYVKARQAEPGIRDEGLEKDLGGAKTSPPPVPKETNHPIPAEAGEAGDDDESEPDSYPSNSADAPSATLNPDLPVEFERPSVKFENVGGMNAVKEEIRMKIIHPLKNPDLFRQYGKKIGGGVLLYGPPGCGKTLLSRATAGEIKATFLSIGIHQVLDMWLGNSEKNLHQIFELARQNTPAILFFDEVDALGSDRTTMKQSAGRNVINQFLAEMDGSANNEGILILGATNAPWQVDPAFRRPGRFDRVLFVPPPDEEARASIIELMAKDKPTHKLDARALAKRTKDFSGADLKAVFDVASEEKLAIAMRENRIVPITTDDLIRAAKSMQPSTKAWFESAKNYALYANQSGFYNDVLAFLGIKK